MESEVTDQPDTEAKKKVATGEDMFDLLVKQSQRIFLNPDEPNPELPVGMFVAVDAEDNLMVVQAPWRNEQEKEQLLLRIKMLFREKGVKMYGLGQETWSVMRNKEQHEKDPRAPSQCDDRQEHILYAVVEAGKPAIVRRQEIVRPWDGGHPTLGLIEDMPYQSITGRMLELLDFDTWDIGGIRISRKQPVEA